MVRTWRERISVASRTTLPPRKPFSQIGPRLDASNPPLPVEHKVKPQVEGTAQVLYSIRRVGEIPDYIVEGHSEILLCKKLP